VYIQQEFIKPNTVERREYQVNIADSATKKNTLVVLPTGMGKTVIALVLIAKQLQKQDNKILFLAPTKPLVTQHAQYLKQNLTIDENIITVFTGEVSPEKRKQTWEDSRIIVSTPQVIQNDLISKKISLKDVSFIIYDESHHAVGDYAYVYVSEMHQKQRETERLALGITASPGNDVKTILEVCKNLDINNIEIRTKYDPDVKPYVYDLKITWKEILLPRDFAYTLQLLKKSLSERLQFLKDAGFIESSSVSMINRTKLLDAQKRIQAELQASMKPPSILFKAASTQNAALKIYYAIELLQTQGVNALKNYFQRMGKESVSKDSSKASREIMADRNILEAIAYVKSLNIEHPKVQEITNIISEQLKNKPDSKIIVFTHYRDTSAHLLKHIEQIENAKPVRFIGQAERDEDKGLTQKQQANIIKQFKEDTYNILIATSVAEEGLDIPSTDLVVFYEPIPSEIRTIQRRGRTGRKMPGNVIILITKDTQDEAYYWAAKRKEKQMRSELEILRSKISKQLEDTKTLYDKPLETQTTLPDYQKQQKQVTIIVDHREYRSPVAKNLTLKEANVEAQQLDTGDYILSTRIGVERKTVEDYLGSMIEGKLFKQAAKLREAYPRPILIIEGEGLLTKRNISHNAIYGSIVSIIVDFGIPVITTKNPMETANLLYIIAAREQRDEKKPVATRGEKTPMSTREKQQFIVEGLPNISAVLAKRLLEHFGSIKDIVNASEEELKEIQGIGKNIATEIQEILNTRYLED